ncbi:DUF4212 domain-containing protein [Geomesophilobacter sediminis]|uniref:DUF4212 domain-containing protein n=1 Tax=Geomesophilobacter sediminis TaxID=2798584 RepID=A0A8J7JLP3_9BACT|nr:DUF4212 domain-containing protein [Geomesophilobacter sediminis]MBJ6725120.1 DUF4212 domain-containing protein [Geomesophilobacter sediminis]
MSHAPKRYSVNLLRPKKGYMRDEVGTILLVLLGWGLVTFGFQIVLALWAGTPLGRFLTQTYLFNLPLHFFFSGQFLPLWFIILCVFYNYRLDRITEYHSHMRDRSYE